MIVKTYEVEKIKKTNFNFFLLYGENEGLKNEIIKNVLTQEYKNQIIKLEENEIINKHHLLYEEVKNKSLFESKKIIIISRATDKINKVVEALLNEKL